MEKLNPDKKDKELISTARTATLAYAETGKLYQEEQKRGDNSAKLAELDTRSAEAGNAVAKAATTYLVDKQVDAQKISDSVFLVAEVANTANAARLNNKEYLLSQDPKNWTALNEEIAKLDKLYDDLKKVSSTEEDLQKIDAADKATQEYLGCGQVVG